MYVTLLCCMRMSVHVIRTGSIVVLTRGACFVSSLESSPIPPIINGTSAYCNSTNDIFGAVTGTLTILS